MAYLKCLNFWKIPLNYTKYQNFNEIDLRIKTILYIGRLQLLNTELQMVSYLFHYIDNTKPNSSQGDHYLFDLLHLKKSISKNFSTNLLQS